jgi:hypothetical protein
MAGPVRVGMADLLWRVRALVGDLASAGSARLFTDLQVQEVLDRNRLDVPGDAYRALQPDYPWTGDPHDYYDPDGLGDWDGETVVTDGAGTTLTPDTADLLTGHWSFSSGQTSPVYVVGRTYDVYGAASDLCPLGMALTARGFDVGQGGVVASAAAPTLGWDVLQEHLSAQARPRAAPLHRSDVW